MTYREFSYVFAFGFFCAAILFWAINAYAAPNPYSVCGMYHPKDESSSMEFRQGGMTKLTGLVCFKPEEWSALPASVKSEIEVWPGWRWTDE